MTPLDMLAVLAAGVGAGAINTVVGSGTLLTFPVLLATGLPPVTATVSNALGIIPGSLSGAIGYRAELAGQRARVLRLGAGAALGGLAGATLLLVLPASAFEFIVPVLVGLALVLVVLQPRVSARVRQRAQARREEQEEREEREERGERGENEHRARGGTRVRPDGGRLLPVGITLASVYGGYFAAAQGIIYLSLMGSLLDEPLQRLNAVKNVLAAVVNTVAAVFFLFAADFDWTAVGLLAVGSAAGGQLGARYGRRLSPKALRVFIVVVGLTAITQLLLR